MSKKRLNEYLVCLDELTPEEQDAINKYKIAGDGLAYRLNAVLRNKNLINSSDLVITQHLDSAIKKCQAICNLILYRATWAEDFDRFVQENIFTDPAFASTSLVENSLSEHFVSNASSKPVKLIIECPAGSNLINMELDNDSGVSEYEMLLPRGSRYEIISTLTLINKTEIANEIVTCNTLHINDFQELRVYEVKLVV